MIKTLCYKQGMNLSTYVPCRLLICQLGQSYSLHPTEKEIIAKKFNWNIICILYTAIYVAAIEDHEFHAITS